MEYKAIICDVDGTLVPNRPEGMPSKKVIEAIKKANKKIKIGVATARSYWQINRVLDVLDLNSPCIITGGAQIIDPKTRKTFVEKNVSTKDIEEIANIAKEMEIKLTVANREGEFAYKKNEIPEKPLDLYTSPLTKEKADNFIKKVSHISTIATHKAVAWREEDKICVTIANPNASKLEALVQVAGMLKIKTTEVIGIGEGYNDFPFMMACGLKVAMGNAVDDIKQIADHIVPSVAEDGVAYFLEKFIL